ncbi:hypothetical protein HA402_000970 [Bradysia odoriphaga]|nr:hypothetical protein HA402_000970 [Bradysia odoriphaga]
MDKLSKSTQTESTVAASISTNTANATKIYAFEIKLNHGHKVPIWRTIEVPATYSFYDLHVAIQDSMGWSDSHLHKFNMINPANNRGVHIGIPDDWMSKSIKPEKHTPIANYFSPSNAICAYEYDFASPWNFHVTLKTILEKDANARYPRCVAGNCASPPEECPADPSDMSWVKQPFDYSKITFRDPVEAWEDAFQGF